MKNLILILLGFACLTGCSDDETSSDNERTVFRQYADSVIDFSSQYNESPKAWSADMLLGKENVYPNYGDLGDAWTQARGSKDRQYLVLGFDTVQTVSTIEIYETYYPGAIDTVYLRNATSLAWETIYTGVPVNLSVTNSARIFKIEMEETEYEVDAIRIAIDYPFYWETYHNSLYPYVEIDAIAISGTRQ